jgi:hypothetical protein
MTRATRNAKRSCSVDVATELNKAFGGGGIVVDGEDDWLAPGTYMATKH